MKGGRRAQEPAGHRGATEVLLVMTVSSVVRHICSGQAGGGDILRAVQELDRVSR